VRASRYAWITVAVLWFIWLLNYLDRQIIFSVFPPLQKDLRLSNVQLGLLGTSFLWVYAAASPVSGFLADRYGRKTLIVGSLFVWSSMTWATSRAQTFTALLFIRSVMGLSEACYLPAALALIASVHSVRTRSFATGIHYTGSYVGTVLGGFLGGWVAEHYGWRSVFGILGILGIAYSAFAIATLRDPPDEPAWDQPRQIPHFRDSLSKLFSLPGYTSMMVVFASVSIADWAVYTWMPTYLFEKFHMSLAEAGFSATFYSKVGSVGGILIGGILADRLGSKLSQGRIWVQSVALTLAAPFLLLAGFAGRPLPLLLALFLFGFGKGAYDCNTMPILCQIAKSELRSTGFGIFNCVGSIAGGIIALIGGQLRDTFGLGAFFQLAAVLLLAGSVFLWRIHLPHTQADLARTAHAQ
jgi:MFS transporter, Spinster family, sphingosine-1-phosphate transporter